jgi:predicted outer membrane repeat protein
MKGNTQLTLSDFKANDIQASGTKTIISIVTGGLEINSARITSVKITNRPAILVSSFASIILKDIYFEDAENTLMLLKSSNITAQSIEYDANLKPHDVSFLECLLCTSITLNNSKISRSNSPSSGGVIRIIGRPLRDVKSNNSMIIFNCTFFSNKANEGGVLYIRNERISIYSTTFTSNSAKSFGGAVSFSSQFEEKNDLVFKWNLKNNTFNNNMAALSGGAVYWQVSEPENIRTNIFLTNRAAHGQNVASNPYYIIPTNESVKILASGQTASSNISLILVDAYKQMVNHMKEGFATLFWDESSNSSKSEIKGMFGQLTAEVTKGEFNFSDITLIATPKTISLLGVKTEIIPFMNPHIKNIIVDEKILDFTYNSSKHKFYHTENSETKNYEMKMELEFRDCIRGEIYNIEQNICEKCPRGQFSLSPSDKICQDCPIEAECAGGDKITIRTGYWRSSTSSLRFYECNFFFKIII